MFSEISLHLLSYLLNKHYIYDTSFKRKIYAFCVLLTKLIILLFVVVCFV